MDAYGTGEITLAKAVLPRLEKGMLCLADRQFFGFEMWQLARATGADLLWRMKKNMRMACEKRLSDGSYLSHVYPSERDWRRKTNGIVVRVIDYRLEGVAGAEPIYRLVTTILEEEKALPTGSRFTRSNLALKGHEDPTSLAFFTSVSPLTSEMRGTRRIRLRTPTSTRAVKPR